MKESTDKENSKDHMINMVVDLDHYIARAAESSSRGRQQSPTEGDFQLSHRLMGNKNGSKSAKQRNMKSLYDADIFRAMNAGPEQFNFEFMAHEKL